MEKIKVHDKFFELYIKGEQIAKRVEDIAQNINKDYEGQQVLFIGVLNGSFMFFADLLKKIKLEASVSFIKLSSYSGTQTTGYAKQIIGLTENIENKNVIVVEDIVDTGITLDGLLKQLLEQKPKSLKIAALLFKPLAFKKNFKIDYLGFEIPNEFVIGYGLDYNSLGRNYPDIYKIKQ